MSLCNFTTLGSADPCFARGNCPPPFSLQFPINIIYLYLIYCVSPDARRWKRAQMKISLFSIEIYIYGLSRCRSRPFVIAFHFPNLQLLDSL